MEKLKKILSNKVLLYVSTRYLVYGLQFVSLILLASKLGQFNYGRWGFIVMLLSYFSIINFGIPNSINVLSVQYKNDIKRKKDYIASSVVAILCLVLLIILIGIIYSIWPEELFSKYSIGSKFYLILIIGSLQYLNVLMVNIFRASNKLLEIAIYQSSIPVGIFIAAIFFDGSELISVMVWTYLIMNGSSLIIFLIRGREFWGGMPSIKDINFIAKKGIFLFIYNACFYLIVTTASTLVSNYYTVSQYGDYSFSYTLGHSILLLMEAFVYVIFPKVIDKLYSGDNEIVDKTIHAVRINYICLAHFLIYFAFAFFPILIKLFPVFRSSLITLNFMMLAIVLSTNSFGYNTLLIARNKEKISARISIIALCTNLIFGWCLIRIFKVQYYYMPFTIIVSYITFAVLCCIEANKVLNRHLSFVQIINLVMPIRIGVPYFVALLISYINITYLSFIPIMVFCLLNKSTIMEISNTAKRIVNSPNIVDITK